MKDDEPDSPLSPPSPALLRRASTQIARYGSVNHSHSSSLLVLPPRQAELNRRASVPVPNNRLSGNARYGSAAGLRNNAFAASSPNASIPPYPSSIALSLPAQAAASYSMPDMAAVLPTTPHSIRSSSSATSFHTPAGRQSPSPTPPSIASAPRQHSSPMSDAAGDRVVYLSSTPPHAALSVPAAVSPGRISRSPQHASLTVVTPHRSSPHSAPYTQEHHSRSANNLYAAWQPSPSHAPISLSPFHQQQMQLPPQFTLSPSAGHSSPAEDEEDHWYAQLFNTSLFIVYSLYLSLAPLRSVQPPPTHPLLC